MYQNHADWQRYLLPDEPVSCIPIFFVAVAVAVALNKKEKRSVVPPSTKTSGKKIQESNRAERK